MNQRKHIFVYIVMQIVIQIIYMYFPPCASLHTLDHTQNVKETHQIENRSVITDQKGNLMN